MKIGIFTHPLDYNYGCLLQAYALQKTLKSMGHEVVTLNRFSDPNQSFPKLLRNWCVRFLQRLVKHKKVPLCWDIVETMDIKKTLSVNTQRFVDRNIVNTGQIFPNDLQNIDEKYMFDAYVVGSDQVWLPHFCPNSFLDFVKRDNVKRVFYAASSGKYCFSDYPNLVNQCRELVKCFSGISVREESLIQISKDYLGVDAELVLDPTLLLNSEDYLSACVETSDYSPSVFTYILDKTPTKLAIIKKVSEELQLPISNGTVEKNYVVGKSMNIYDCIYPSVDSWVQKLEKSRFVVTDSFHGTCMAILFNKPFVVIGNVERGLERFNSLLKIFHLRERLITDVKDFNNSFYEELNQQELAKILKERREQSISFLKNCLK